MTTESSGGAGLEFEHSDIRRFALLPIPVSVLWRLLEAYRRRVNNVISESGQYNDEGEGKGRRVLTALLCRRLLIGGEGGVSIFFVVCFLWGLKCLRGLSTTCKREVWRTAALSSTS